MKRQGDRRKKERKKKIENIEIEERNSRVWKDHKNAKYIVISCMRLGSYLKIESLQRMNNYCIADWSKWPSVRQ